MGYVLEVTADARLLGTNGTRIRLHFMRLSSANTKQTDSVAGYLADREGLKGASRAKFVTLLRDAFGFDLQRSNGRVSALGISLGAATLAGR